MFNKGLYGGGGQGMNLQMLMQMLGGMGQQRPQQSQDPFAMLRNAKNQGPGGFNPGSGISPAQMQMLNMGPKPGQYGQGGSPPMSQMNPFSQNPEQQFNRNRDNYNPPMPPMSPERLQAYQESERRLNDPVAKAELESFYNENPHFRLPPGMMTSHEIKDPAKELARFREMAQNPETVQYYKNAHQNPPQSTFNLENFMKNFSKNPTPYGPATGSPGNYPQMQHQIERSPFPPFSQSQQQPQPMPGFQGSSPMAQQQHPQMQQPRPQIQQPQGFRGVTQAPPGYHEMLDARRNAGQ